MNSDCSMLHFGGRGEACRLADSDNPRLSVRNFSINLKTLSYNLRTSVGKRTRLALIVPIDSHTGSLTAPSSGANTSRLPSNLAFDTFLITEPEPFLPLTDHASTSHNAERQQLRSF